MSANSFRKPRIATGVGPSGGGKKHGMGEYKGKSGSKSPEGGRPTPRVAQNSLPKGTSTGGGRRAVKPTPMARQKRGSTAHRNR